MVRSIDERGIALIVVLWVALLIAVLASAFVLDTRSEAKIARNFVDSAEARALADGGVQLAIHQLLAAGPGGTPSLGAALQSASIGDGAVSIAIEDEGGKVDLNTAADPLLRGALLAAGAPESLAASLLDRIRDWRDPDHLQRPQGAEDPAYQAAGLDYGAKDGPFERVDELQQVLGMPRALYERLRRVVTVYSGRPGIDPRTASRGALLAIPGTTAEQVDAFIAARSRGAADPAVTRFSADPSVIRYGSPSSGRVFTVRSQAKSHSGARFTRIAVIELSGTARLTAAIREWRDGDRRDFPEIADPAAKDAASDPATVTR